MTETDDDGGGCLLHWMVDGSTVGALLEKRICSVNVERGLVRKWVANERE